MATQLYLNEIRQTAENLTELVPKLKDKCVMVTGASGVIGKELVDILLACNDIFESNIKVVAVGRNKEKLAQVFDTNKCLKLIDYSEVKVQKAVNYIIHLASITSSKMFVENPVEVLVESFSLTKDLLDFGLQNKIDRFVYVSSVEVYGKPYTNQTKLSENCHGEVLTDVVRNSYPEAKRHCEMLTTAYVSEYGLNAIIVRPAKVFSAAINKQDKRVFVDFANKVVNGEDIVLKSDGSQVFTYCYGSDVVCGMLFAMLRGECGGIYNIGSDNCVASIKDIANEYAKQGGVKVVFDIQDNSITGYVNVGHCVLDNSKINALGFVPKVDLNEGIARIIEAYKEL